MRYPNPRRRPTPPPVWLYLVTAAAIIWWLSEPGTPAIFRVWMWMAAFIIILLTWVADTHPARSTR